MIEPMSRREALLFVAGGGVLAATPAWGQGAVIQSQDANIAGVVAEIIQNRRREGVLDLRMRLRNTSDKDVDFRFSGDSYESAYVTAGNKKYFLLRDAERKPLAPPLDGGGSLYLRISKGGSYTWWGRYPAPPADVKKVNFFTAITPPFDEIPIAD